MDLSHWDQSNWSTTAVFNPIAVSVVHEIPETFNARPHGTHHNL
jgi:hypothetical protein